MNEIIEEEINEKHPLIVQLEEYIENQETDEINETITKLEELIYYIKFKKDILTELQKNKINSVKYQEILKKIDDKYKEIKSKSNILNLNQNISESIKELKKLADEEIEEIDGFVKTYKDKLDNWLIIQRDFLEKIKRPTDDLDKISEILKNIDVFNKLGSLIYRTDDINIEEKENSSPQNLIEIDNKKHFQFNIDKLNEIKQYQENIINATSQFENLFDNYDEIRKIWSGGNSISNISVEDFKALKELKELEEVSELIQIKLGN